MIDERGARNHTASMRSSLCQEPGETRSGKHDPASRHTPRLVALLPGIARDMFPPAVYVSHVYPGCVDSPGHLDDHVSPMAYHVAQKEYTIPTL